MPKMRFSANLRKSGRPVYIYTHKMNDDTYMIFTTQVIVIIIIIEITTVVVIIIIIIKRKAMPFI